MAFKTLFALATLATAAFAAPSPLVSCGGGRSVKNAAVRDFRVYSLCFDNNDTSLVLRLFPSFGRHSGEPVGPLLWLNHEVF